MFNNWFSIGPITIHGYGFMIAVGILLAVSLAEKLAKRNGLEYEKIDNFAFFVIVFGYFCSKALYVVTEWEQFLKDPMSVLGMAGWVVYGGIIGGVLGAYLWCRHYKWDFMKYLNTCLCVVPIAQGFGRIGCFLAGCCGGIETDAWYGMMFPADSMAWTTAKIIPTQLISAAGDFLIFVFLYHQLTKSSHPEDTAGWYMILYSIGRFSIEFLRGDAVRGTVGILSTSQFISVFTFLLGAYLIWRRQRKDDSKGEIIQ